MFTNTTVRKGNRKGKSLAKTGQGKATRLTLSLDSSLVDNGNYCRLLLLLCLRSKSNLSLYEIVDRLGQVRRGMFVAAGLRNGFLFQQHVRTVLQNCQVIKVLLRGLPLPSWCHVPSAKGGQASIGALCRAAVGQVIRAVLAGVKNAVAPPRHGGLDTGTDDQRRQLCMAESQLHVFEFEGEVASDVLASAVSTEVPACHPWAQYWILCSG